MGRHSIATGLAEGLAIGVAAMLAAWFVTSSDTLAAETMRGWLTWLWLSTFG